MSATTDLSAPLPPMPETGPMFEYRRIVRTGDVDAGERLRLDGVARYLQDIAFDHIGALPGAPNPVWIVRRTVIDVIRPIAWHSEVHLQRWCSAMSTRWATMRVRLESADDGNGDGGLIETEAFWIHINRETGAPARISDELEAELLKRTTEHRLRWRPLLKETAPDAGDPGCDDDEFRTRLTDIDPLRHVNNTVYLHPVEERLAEVPDLRERPHRVIVEYLRPIAPDAPVRIRCRSDGDGVALWFVVDGVEHARAMVVPLD